jgi:hypothetical protein
MRDHTHCKHDGSGHSGTRAGDYFTSALFSGPCPIGLPLLPLSLSPIICAEFPSTTTLSSKIGSTKSSLPDQADSFNRGVENLPERWETVLNNGEEYIVIVCFIICVKNELYESVRKPHELMHQPNILN